MGREGTRSLHVVQGFQPTHIQLSSFLPTDLKCVLVQLKTSNNWHCNMTVYILCTVYITLTEHDLSSCHKRIPTTKHGASYRVIVASGYDPQAYVGSEGEEARVPHIDSTLCLGLDEEAIHHLIEYSITSHSYNTAGGR